MTLKDKKYVLIWLFLVLAGGWLLTSITSCGKQGNASPQGLNIQYHVLNLSPDLQPVDLFIDNGLVNVAPFYYGVDQGYFYVASTDIPYQIRSAQYTGTTLISMNDILKSGAKYTLFLSGSISTKIDTTFTVDTDFIPSLGHGKLRFVNVSPSGTLDVYANGTQAFKSAAYKSVSKYMELPIGNYDIQLFPAGTSSVIKDLPGITIQDGRLYTLYSYGYTTTGKRFYK
jgi:hypothetical protein